MWWSLQDFFHRCHVLQSIFFPPKEHFLSFFSITSRQPTPCLQLPQTPPRTILRARLSELHCNDRMMRDPFLLPRMRLAEVCPLPSVLSSNYVQLDQICSANVCSWNKKTGAINSRVWLTLLTRMLAPGLFVRTKLLTKYKVRKRRDCQIWFHIWLFGN